MEEALFRWVDSRAARDSASVFQEDNLRLISGEMRLGRKKAFWNGSHEEERKRKGKKKKVPSQESPFGHRALDDM